MRPCSSLADAVLIRVAHLALAIEAGDMTKDLAILISKDQRFLNTQDFLAKLDENLKKKMKA